ncbi:hypothetical protein [Rugosimonospora africana]|uniref:Uncharacterized protein n=1 Tax=Rugosimonospora africana TaxID=556532 RepID=A0A8J3QQ20_9ACTN|nr:hypothetical protein [Rugosimonospora africana]GIH14192.1 hypothetical protein Raf01_23640 [Rugosimonospora africana]
MSRPGSYARTTAPARYRRHRAPPSIQTAALFQYLGALLTLAAAATVETIARGRPHYAALDRVPDSLRRNLDMGGPVIAVALAVLGLCWLLVARKLQRGRQWARHTVMVLSLVAIATAVYFAGLRHDPRVLAGLALPALWAMLLSTDAARAWCRDDGR